VIKSCQREHNRIRSSTFGRASNGKTEGNWHVKHLAFGMFVTAVLSCIFLLFQYLSIEDTVVLTAFNVVFVSMTFPLNGSLAVKATMLLGCEVVGSLWIRIFSLLASRNEGIAGAFLFLSPFVNLGWVITFYSVTLAVLANIGRGD
jgi:hypothetical protein